MKSRLIAKIGSVIIGLSLGLNPWIAKAQFVSGDDPLAVLPQIFVILDSSGSMDEGSFECGIAGTMKCNRLQALKEVLTGTYIDTQVGCSVQKDDGILDDYRELIQFGFGSFDNDRSATWNYADDIGSDWSLGVKDRVGSRCDANEGCLIDFVNPSDPEDLVGNNFRVQSSVCSMNAEGWTPLCAALYDALYHYKNWEKDIGYKDMMGTCRAKFVLLLSDGEENQGCYGDRWSDWGYPNRYDRTFINAEALWSAGTISNPVQELFPGKTAGIPVFVVGFGTQKDYLDPIARAGSGGDYGAFMANNPEELRQVFSSIIDTILTGGSSRTAPSSIQSIVSVNESFQFVAYFEISLDGMWTGHLVRERIADLDGDGNPEFTGDRVYFEDVLKNQRPDSMDPLEGRRVLTVVHDPRSQDPGIDRSNPAEWPRGFSKSDHRLGLYPFESGYKETDPLMCLDTQGERECTNWNEIKVCTAYERKKCEEHDDCGEGFGCRYDYCRECRRWGESHGERYCRRWGSGSQEVCTNEEIIKECTNWKEISEAKLAELVKDFVRGVGGTPARGGSYTVPTDGPPLGDIFHSSPIVVGPPSSISPDYNYESYFRMYGDRHTMLYVGANDGMLHAFVAEDNKDDGRDDTGKELWAFIPNNLLAKIQQTRWGHNFFVDGTPIIRDMYFKDLPTPDPMNKGDCLKNGSDCFMGAYRTVLVSGERKGGSAYFALDVTDPEDPKYLWEYRTHLPVTADYVANQCETSQLQGWAEPILGQVWLKKAGVQEEYEGRSVAIVPGGYMPPQSLLGVNSCIDFVENMVGSSSLYIIDVETGKLLRKFLFSNAVSEDSADMLEKYYKILSTNPSANFNCWGKCFSGEGWSCDEKRNTVSKKPYLPEELLKHCVEYEDDIIYEKECCYTPSTGDGKCPASGYSPCYYKFSKKKGVPGGLDIELKTEGCALVPNDEESRFHLDVADDFWVETVASTPVAFNTSLGQSISRVFVPTTRGNVYRIDVRNAEFNPDAPEGEMVGSYTSGSIEYDWSVSLWYDMTKNDMNSSTAVRPRRPITAKSTLALNYAGNLVMFFGTGETDSLEFKDAQDYVFAVEEWRDYDAEGYYVPQPVGKLFTQPLVLPEKDERVFAKPLVVAGKIIFSTYRANPDVCNTGVANVYVYPFDNFDPGELIFQKTMKQTGTPSAPAIVWTNRGPKVVIQQGTKQEILPLGEQDLNVSYVFSWAKVL